METKTLSGVEIKDADEGTVEAVFSTFDVVDDDKDVVRPGAFTDGAKVRISAYGHRSWHGELPVGRGTIHSTDSEAILDGKFFLDTTHGRDTFATVKQMGDLQEWSYSLDKVEESFGEFEGEDVRFLNRIEVTEVSPVLRGASVNTRTLAAKSSCPQCKGTTLARVIAGLRDSSELTNADLAEAAEVSVSAVRQVLQRDGGITCPPLSRLEGFARALDVPTQRLVDAAKADGCEYETETRSTDPVVSKQIANEYARFVMNLRS